MLFLSAFAETDKESGANRLRKLREGLAIHGWQVDWLGPTGGYIVHGAGRKLGALHHLWRGTRAWARKNDGKILLSLPPPWLLGLGFFLALFYSKRLIVDFRDPILNQAVNPRGLFYRISVGALQWFLVKRAALVIVCAERIGDYLPCPEKSKLTVLAGLDAEELAETQQSSEARNNLRIVYGGTFYGSRSPLPLLEAIAKAAPDLQFDFYVNFQDPSQAQETQNKVKALGLGQRIQFHAQLPRERFLQELRQSGAGLVITHSIGSEYAIPGKIFDYITAGVVSWVVSTDAGLLEFLDRFEIPSVITPGWEENQILEGIKLLRETLTKNLPAKEAGGHALLAAEQAKLFVEKLEKL